MHVTIVNRYFWPESVLVNDISVWLSEDGHDVTVLTGQPDYNPEAKIPKRPRMQVWKGVTIRCLSLFDAKGRGLARNFNSLLFVLLAALKILFGPKTDVVWSTSIPPIVQPLLLRFATWLRGAQYVYFPQDIYPEIATATGMMDDGFLARILKRVDSWTLSRADAVVTISNDMVDLIRERGGTPRRLEMIRSFSASEEPRPKRQQIEKGAARFVFAGNIGRFQNLDALVDAFTDVDSNQAVLELLGDGREKVALQERVSERGLQNVRFHDFLPVEEAFHFVAGCDVGIVSLRPEIYRYAFPAKFYTYIGAGIPMLVFVEHESELATIVNEREIGVVVGWDDGKDAARKAVEELVRNYDTYQANIYENTDDLYLPSRARKEWLELFRSLDKVA